MCIRDRDGVDTLTLIPAFMLSELKTAFLLGFKVYLPFLIIDLVISTIPVSYTHLAGQFSQIPGSFAAAWNLALADVQTSQSRNVPEPASCSVLGLSAAGLMARRRRR